MGNSRIRRAQFFAAHPLCCFCGGDGTANEEDHIPARSLFRERMWPEGYVFPACSECNRDSAADELAMGWLVRICISKPSDATRKDLRQALSKLKDRRPDFVGGIKFLTRTEVRQGLRDRGMSFDEFGGEVDMAKMPGEVYEIAGRYGKKLGKALYYLHKNRIVSKDQTVDAIVYANADVMSKDFRAEEFEALTSRPVLSRAGRSLDEQFSYRFAAGVDDDSMAFLSRFGESMAIAIFVLSASGLREAEAGLANPPSSSTG